MKSDRKSSSVFLAAAGIVALSFMTLADAQSGVGNNDKDVNVVNTPDVFIANEDPIPVTVENNGAGGVEYVSVSSFALVTSPTARVDQVVFQVPAGKILIADYISIWLDVVVTNRPITGLRIAGRLDGRSTGGPTATVDYNLGYMEEFVRTSRGTPNFIVARQLTAYFTEGPVKCVADTHYAGSDLDFGGIECAISGRLIDAP